jgi:ProP effector
MTGKPSWTVTADAVICLLSERWPRAFAIYEKRRRPLKVGIHTDLAAALDGALDRRELAIGLRRYCSSRGYLLAMRAGAARIDLDGNVTGILTAEDEAHAKQRLARRSRSSRTEGPAAPVARPHAAIHLVPAATPARRRDGLAGLRKAAAARKQQQGGGP